MYYCIFLRISFKISYNIFAKTIWNFSYNSRLMFRLFRLRSSISVLTFPPSLCSCLTFVPDLSLRICSVAFLVLSRGTIDVSIPGRCSLAFAIVSMCFKSAGVVCLAVLCLSRAFLSICFSIFLYFLPFSISFLFLLWCVSLRLKINKSSAFSRACVRESIVTKVHTRKEMEGSSDYKFLTVATC